MQGARTARSDRDSRAADEADILATTAGRRIELPGLLNFRDLGGYPAAGGTVKRGALFRSDGLHRLDADSVATLAGLGLHTIVDLRTQAEAELAPSMLSGLTARLRHISVLGGDMASLPLELEAIYHYMIGNCGGSIAAAIGVLCGADALPALVHCSAGKDRTGIVIALTLAVLGVRDEVIAADYALSARYLDPDRTPAIGQLQASTGLGDGLTRPLLTSPPELILAVLAWVRQSAGSVERYLQDNGLSVTDLDRLRSALLV